jgi:hypothetical protein
MRRGTRLAVILLLLVLSISIAQENNGVSFSSVYQHRRGELRPAKDAAQNEFFIHLPLILHQPPPRYYIDATNGNDRNNGKSPENAWRTLRKVSEEFADGTFVAGDHILFKRGETWKLDESNDGLDIRNCSGTIDRHIYIGAYGTGARPVFDADDNSIKAISHSSDWDDANYVTIADIEIKNVYNTVAVKTENVHHWILKNLHIHDITMRRGGWAAAIRIADSSEYVWIQDCTITRIMGEGVYLGTPDLPSDRTRRVTISGCDISYCDAEAIDCKDATQSSFVYNSRIYMNGSDASLDHSQISLGGRFHVIYQSVISGTRGENKEAIYIGRYQGGDVTNSGRYNRIERSLIKDATGEHGGVYLAGDHNAIINCTIVDSSYGIYGVPSDDGGHSVRNNIFTGINDYPVYLSDIDRGYDFDYNDYSDGATDVWYTGGDSRDFSYVQGVLGQELNGITSDASFSEMDTYMLGSNSPCIDAGDSSATVYDWNDEYGSSGAEALGAVDMGWREYDWVLPHRVFASSFESSSLARFTGYSGISVATEPAPGQGVYSMRVHITDTDDRYAYRSNLGDLKHFYASFYVHAQSLIARPGTMLTGDSFNIFEGRTLAGNNLVVVQLRYNGLRVQIRVGIVEDDSSWTYTDFFALGPGWELVEIFWMAAPYQSEYAGELILWLNGVEKAHKDDLNNHNEAVDSFYIGAPSGLDVGTQGNLYIDAVELDWVRRINE